MERSLTAIAQECYELYWTSSRGSIPQSSSCTDTNHSSRKPSKLDEQDIRDTPGEVRASSQAIYSGGPPHTDDQGLGDQLKPINNSSVLIRDVAWKTYRERWTIGTSGGRGLGKSVRATRHDDDDIYIYMIYIYIYITIVIHRQICFVLSEFISVARQYLSIAGIETRLTQTPSQSF